MQDLLNKIAVHYGNTPEEASGDMVSGNFFAGMGERAACGRRAASVDPAVALRTE